MNYGLVNRMSIVFLNDTPTPDYASFIILPFKLIFIVFFFQQKNGTLYWLLAGESATGWSHKVRSIGESCRNFNPKVSDVRYSQKTVQV